MHPSTSAVDRPSSQDGKPDVPVTDGALGDALRLAARRWPHACALVSGDEVAARRARWTFAELLVQAEKAAWALLARFRPGDHVAIWAPNCAEWVFIELGAALAGITLVTVNPGYQASELAHVLGQSLSKGIIFWPVYRGRALGALVAEVRAGLPLLQETLSMDEWNALVTDAVPCALPDVGGGDIAQIQYTSGTTGFPKGAELTHRGLANNARFYAEAIGAVPGDVWVNPMPMFHTAGCGLVTLGALQTGGVHVLPAAFEPELMLDLLESERGTIVLSVPTMLIRMLDQPSLSTRDLRAWRLATLGGAPVPPELVRRAQALLPLKVCIGFGQTESSPYITHTAPDDPHPQWWLTVGRPLPHTELKVVDPETGATLAGGAVGEICARSCCVMKGYHLDPAATARAIDTEDWLHTGDLGSLDEFGYLRVQGRLKDMIIALRAARDGANVAIAAKTSEPHPTLPGTLNSVAAEIRAAGGQALPLLVDVRDDAALREAVETTAKTFGGIDVLVNNASALFLAKTPDTPMKRFDLMFDVNVRGTFAATQACHAHLAKAGNPHVLVLSPPLKLKAAWFADHCAYTMSKYAMSLCVLGMAEEFRPLGIAVNALWPRTMIDTAASGLIGVPAQGCRTVDIMADAAHAILTRDSRSASGNFYLDDTVLGEEGAVDFGRYDARPGSELVLDLFVD